jgi:hypothetical protein
MNGNWVRLSRCRIEFSITLFILYEKCNYLFKKCLSNGQFPNSSWIMNHGMQKIVYY